MKAVFSYSVRYIVTARCLTPLRTADAEGNADEVLQASDGVCFVQGSSIAGALRAWAEANEGTAAAESLFGSNNRQGSLIVSDARFSDTAAMELRPRLRIDDKTGSAAEGSKFDVAHIGKGAEMIFTLCWLGEKSTLAETEAVERLLAAMHNGQILLGAQKTNGFGRVSLRVLKQTYDMHDPEDRDRWISDEKSGWELELPEVRTETTAVFSLRGKMDSLLVKAAAEEHGSGGSYTPSMTEAGTPVIPGSSVKGAIRARCELISEYMDLPKSFTEKLFGRMAENGDTGLPGRIRFEDIVFEPHEAKKITRIRINRFTGGVIRGGLFSEEPVSGEFTTTIHAPADDKAGCMLLLYALRDLAIGLYGFGSGTSIGRGFPNIDDLTVRTPEGQTLSLVFDSERNCAVIDPDHVLTEWRRALEAI